MKYLILSAALLGLSACSSNNSSSSSPEEFSYQISLTNITAAQPFSPPAALLTNGNYKAWSTGEAASVALEQLAEGGDASALIADQSTQPNFLGSSPIPPGGNLSFELTVQDETMRNLTLATMLVNTNDAFTGLSAIDLGTMETGDKRVYLTQAYDAGTENNLETAGTIPGPVDGGEGFNAARDDVTSVVTFHGGIVSSDDGYAESVLSETHKFDNPVMVIEVTRL